MVVYPRWRGEHLFSQIYGLLLFGLSPLARGTRAHGIQSRVSARFIPAGAGNTGSATAAPMTTSVYPRWRGEHCSVVFILPACHGLSPLARGTLPYRLPDIIFLRFIPAGAGNTCCSSWWSAAIAVYPRWRGEHAAIIQKRTQGIGLSPLARGTRRDYSKEDAGDRFIPAGAGNTFKYVYLLIAISGLSPLARGTLLQCQQSFPDCRFIPAGAGNTIEIVFGIYSEAVYPRWRGEHAAVGSTVNIAPGLSPLARGTRGECL